MKNLSSLITPELSFKESLEVTFLIKGRNVLEQFGVIVPFIPGNVWGVRIFRRKTLIKNALRFFSYNTIKLRGCTRW